MLTAEKAINDDIHPQNFCHTGKSQAGEYWQADFATGSKRVYDVQILNRRDGCGERLAAAKIEIDGKYFGSLPEVTHTDNIYIITNKDGVFGKQIKVI